MGAVDEDERRVRLVSGGTHDLDRDAVDLEQLDPRLLRKSPHGSAEKRNVEDEREQDDRARPRLERRAQPRLEESDRTADFAWTRG